MRWSLWQPQALPGERTACTCVTHQPATHASALTARLSLHTHECILHPTGAGGELAGAPDTAGHPRQHPSGRHGTGTHCSHNSCSVSKRAMPPTAGYMHPGAGVQPLCRSDRSQAQCSGWQCDRSVHLQGKTAQAICFLGVLKAVEQDPGPHLIVVPASLLENW